LLARWAFRAPIELRKGVAVGSRIRFGDDESCPDAGTAWVRRRHVVQLIVQPCFLLVYSVEVQSQCQVRALACAVELTVRTHSAQIAFAVRVARSETSSAFSGCIPGVECCAPEMI